MPRGAKPKPTENYPKPERSALDTQKAYDNKLARWRLNARYVNMTNDEYDASQAHILKLKKKSNDKIRENNRLSKQINKAPLEWVGGQNSINKPVPKGHLSLSDALNMYDRSLAQDEKDNLVFGLNKKEWTDIDKFMDVLDDPNVMGFEGYHIPEEVYDEALKYIRTTWGKPQFPHLYV
jgi:hypothetical protein